MIGTFFSGKKKEKPATIKEKLRLDAEKAKMVRESKPPAVQYTRRKPPASATTDADNAEILRLVMEYCSLTCFTNSCRKTISIHSVECSYYCSRE